MSLADGTNEVIRKGLRRRVVTVDASTRFTLLKWTKDRWEITRFVAPGPPTTVHMGEDELLVYAEREDVLPILSQLIPPIVSPGGVAVEKRERGWALVATARGVTQERLFYLKADALRALEEFKHYSEFELAGEFNHYFRERSYYRKTGEP